MCQRASRPTRLLGRSRNAEPTGGVQAGGGGPTTRRRRTRRASAARRRGRLRGARAHASGNRLSNRLADHRDDRRSRGGCPRRLRQGIPGARPVPAGAALSAVAARDRRQRGTQPQTLGGPARRHSSCARRRRSARGTRPRPPRRLHSATSAAELLLSAVDGLPVEQRLVVGCRYFLDLSEAETATTLGIRAGTVKSRLARALERLREEVPADV